jgi:hypothetical protein
LLSTALEVCAFEIIAAAAGSICAPEGAFVPDVGVTAEVAVVDAVVAVGVTVFVVLFVEPPEAARITNNPPPTTTSTSTIIPMINPTPGPLRRVGGVGGWPCGT